MVLPARAQHMQLAKEVPPARALHSLRPVGKVQPTRAQHTEKPTKRHHVEQPARAHHTRHPRTTDRGQHLPREQTAESHHARRAEEEQTAESHHCLCKEQTAESHHLPCLPQGELTARSRHPYGLNFGRAVPSTRMVPARLDHRARLPD